MSLFESNTFTLIGMVHLPPLPGAPAYEGSMAEVLAPALQEARLLAESGFEALLVENYHDAPFYPEKVPPETTAAMAVVVDRLRQVVNLPVGVNVLRCDPPAALAVAATTGAAFVRLNVHTWPVITDQGVLTGQAHQTLRQRTQLCPDTQLWVDVGVKHGRSLAPSLAQEAADNVRRGGAQALLVSGPATGAATAIADLEALAGLELGVPLLVGSGITTENLAAYVGLAQGAVVGTSLKAGSVTSAAVDPARARALVRLRDSLV